MKRECRKYEWDKKHNCVEADKKSQFLKQSTKSTQETQTDKSFGRVSFATQGNL